MHIERKTKRQMARPRARPWGKKDTKQIWVRNLRKWDYWQFSIEVDFTKIWSENDEIWSADKNKKNPESGRNLRFEPLWDNMEKEVNESPGFTWTAVQLGKIIFLVSEKISLTSKIQISRVLASAHITKILIPCVLVQCSCCRILQFPTSCRIPIMPNTRISHILKKYLCCRKSKFPIFLQPLAISKVQIPYTLVRNL